MSLETGRKLSPEQLAARRIFLITKSFLLRNKNFVGKVCTLISCPDGEIYAQNSWINKEGTYYQSRMGEFSIHPGVVGIVDMIISANNKDTNPDEITAEEYMLLCDEKTFEIIKNDPGSRLWPWDEKDTYVLLRPEGGIYIQTKKMAERKIRHNRF